MALLCSPTVCFSGAEAKITANLEASLAVNVSGSSSSRADGHVVEVIVVPLADEGARRLLS
jgi:hypothetical protein